MGMARCKVAAMSLLLSLRASLLLVPSVAFASFAIGCDDAPGRVSNLVESRAPLPDVVGQDGVVFDTSSDTSSDTSVPDTSRPDTTPADTAQPDATDSTPVDTTPQDTTPQDTTPQDTTPADTTPQDTTPADTTPQDTTPQDTGPVGPVDLNVGFIGGACDAVGDCDYASSTCKPASDGWDNGMCSQSCTSTCPDQAGAAVTFCIDGDSVGDNGGLCVQKCDFTRSPTGCRDGYSCGDELRNNTTITSAWACLPGTYEGCLQTLQALGVPFTVPGTTTYDNVDGKTCEVFEPVRVGPVINGVTFHPSDFGNAPTPLYVQCGTALALYATAELAKERDITDIVHYGTYNCRYIAGTTTLSQHSFAYAIDIAGVETASGDQYTIQFDWEVGEPDPQTEGGELLYWMAHEMYDRHIWNIILTPEYNAAHYNHFHVDLTPGSWFLSE